jgi:hypothetical protein
MFETPSQTAEKLLIRNKTAKEENENDVRFPLF